jgi:5-oxoprolinase (ATP-hydrolysing) subunit C
MSECPALEVARVAGLALVEDLGRPGRMHEGVTPGGALVPELLRAANHAAASPAGAAAIERTGALSLVARGGPARIATSEGRVVDLAEGDRADLDAPSATRVGYVAVRGGLDTPIVLGGRGTLLVARLGGVEGRMLRRGDLLPVGSAAAVSGETPGPLDLESPLRVVPSADLSRFAPDALAGLVSLPFEVSAIADRVGTRLEGHALGRVDADDGRSLPMARGAIQVPASGLPIVLGPDHPTTGGYPVLAVIASVDQGRFFARRARQIVRFCAVTVEEARRLAQNAK